MSTTKRYILDADYANQKNIPSEFIGRPLRQSQRAVFIYGVGKQRTTQANATVINRWIPHTVIQRAHNTTETICLPKNHPKLHPQYKQVVKKSAKLVTTKSKNKAIKLTFPFSWETVNKIKLIPNAAFNREHKYWLIPLNYTIIKQLIDIGFNLDDELTNYYHKYSQKNYGEIKVPGLDNILYPYQKQGVAFIENKKGKCLIADEMGLGKTIQALAWLQLHPELRPVVIVVPAVAKLNWKNEALKWVSNPNIEILSGKNPHPITGKIIIINYDIVDTWVRELLKQMPQVLILDECHYLKNNNTKRTKACKKLTKNISYLIGLTGTPIVNRPLEILNIVNMIDLNIFPSRWQFLMQYCGAKHNGYGWDFSGASNTKELHEILTSTCMIRRKKKNVLKELPDKIYTSIPFEIDNKKEYSEARKNLIDWIKQTKGKEKAEKASNAEKFAKFNYLKQLAVKGKMKGMIDWILDFLQNSDEKLGIFTWHTQTLKTLCDEIGKHYSVVYIDGSVPMGKRQKAQDDFQNGNTRAFIGQIKAAGTNLTLTAASHCIVTEFPWTPGDLQQAIDRFHRIGQKNAVNVYYHVAMNTIEEELIQIIDKKTKVLDAVHDGVDTEQKSLIAELSKNYV
jgi:SWI/SNF-related matrix-associated actin-dependent regulator of chromatin subfamily A-like protein 1